MRIAITIVETIKYYSEWELEELEKLSGMSLADDYFGYVGDFVRDLPTHIKDNKFFVAVEDNSEVQGQNWFGHYATEEML